jgi:hypothetical protein
LAPEQFHDGIAHAVVAAEVVNGEDVGVRKRRDRARFALEPGHPVGVRGECRRQDLDRDVPPQPRVTRAIHFAHPAGAEGVQDLVPADSGARLEAHQPRIITPEPWRRRPERFVSLHQRRSPLRETDEIGSAARTRNHFRLIAEE